MPGTSRFRGSITTPDRRTAQGGDARPQTSPSHLDQWLALRAADWVGRACVVVPTSRTEAQRCAKEARSDQRESAVDLDDRARHVGVRHARERTGRYFFGTADPAGRDSATKLAGVSAG
jgi:hypothetical protein